MNIPLLEELFSCQCHHPFTKIEKSKRTGKLHSPNSSLQALCSLGAVMKRSPPMLMTKNMQNLFSHFLLLSVFQRISKNRSWRGDGAVQRSVYAMLPIPSLDKDFCVVRKAITYIMPLPQATQRYSLLLLAPGQLFPPVFNGRSQTATSDFSSSAR